MKKVLAIALVIVLASVAYNKYVNSDIVKIVGSRSSQEVSDSACTPTTGEIEEDIFGLHMWGPYNTHPKTLVAIDDLNTSWVYESIHWPTVEADRDELRIKEEYDRFFLEMARRDMNLVISLGNYWPTWITDSEDLKSQMREMVEAVVLRYKPNGEFAQENGLDDFGVRYWEIINEPNYPCCGWGARGAEQPVDSALYAELLSEVNSAIRQADPQAVILFGGLSSGHTYYDPLLYLEEVYTHGAGECFDVVAFHPYDHVNDFAGVVADLRSVMLRYGDAKKPVWFTELGEPSLTGGGDKYSQIEVFEKSVAQMDVVSAFFWFSLHDFSDTETWGVLDADFNPREPIYSAVKEHIQKKREDL